MALEERDRELARKYGAYASYTETDAAPMLTMDWGESAAGEVDRLLGRYAGPDAIVVDIGCGAGQTLCRLEPRVRAIYGFDQEEDLLTAARERAASLGITNATFLLGNVSNPEDADALPDRMITLAFSRRGPNLPGAFLPKLTPDAVLVQELVGDQDGAGLKELLGRSRSCHAPRATRTLSSASTVAWRCCRSARNRPGPSSTSAMPTISKRI